ncbi:MAG: hypothetical protein HUU20_28935 [Pirellulales bacterium]|nr:hypothetical protein [Pirellulales bacterium]
MLALSLREGEFVFVFCDRRPVGVIVVGSTNGKGRSLLRFSGRKSDFEIVRPNVLEQRYGSPGLQELTEQFLAQDQRKAAQGLPKEVNELQPGAVPLTCECCSSLIAAEPELSVRDSSGNEFIVCASCGCPALAGRPAESDLPGIDYPLTGVSPLRKVVVD